MLKVKRDSSGNTQKAIPTIITNMNTNVYAMIMFNVVGLAVEVKLRINESDALKITDIKNKFI